MTIAYVASIRGKRGNVLFKSQPHPTRVAAAQECFAAKPKARECSTSEVSLRTVGGVEYVVDYGRDIRWVRRDQVAN